MIQIMLTFPYDAEESERFKTEVEKALALSMLKGAEVEVEIVEREQ